MKHNFLFSLLFAFAFVAGSIAAQTSTGDYASKVNTLIGTKGVGLTSGYLYPGATYPYGMVQFTPSYFSKSSGFVINQLSGAGCEHIIESICQKRKGMLAIMRRWYRKISKHS